SLGKRLPLANFGIAGSISVCSGSQVYKATNITEGDITYLWTLVDGGTLNFVDSTATVNWTMPGLHVLQLYISNADGNSETKQINVYVNELPPSVAPVVTKTGRLLQTTALPAGATYQWFKNGTAIIGAVDSFYLA
ncbi:PKD domain-containing protein, partial [Bradyrhizobium sp. NBAIM08]|uniref:PKD domain-containing protein n=1 Tax=Bradyrhizobium sp. NBAIM08 TaxID=2793815 RepID=UPI001CD35F8F